MKVKLVVVDLELSRREKRIVAGLAVPLLLLGGSAVAWGDMLQLHEWKDGDTLTAADLNGNFQALRDAVNDVNPACPRDYVQETAVVDFTLCKKGDDEIVRVGTGASAFWIDRYEASVWDDFANPTKQYGISGYDYPDTFAMTGQFASPLYAISKSSSAASGALTWFQANEACRASGKRLPTGSEWLAAARGTPDPGVSNGAGGVCNTFSLMLRPTGAGTSCQSAWGAEDMIGNIAEWTDEWFASPPLVGTDIPPASPWPTNGVTGSYADDTTQGIDSYAHDITGFVQGQPAVGLRGGTPGLGAGSGIFNLVVNSSPARVDLWLGFRCMLPK